MTAYDPRQLWVVGAGAVLRAVSDERVAAMWDEPSVLEEQTVGSLAGHLARGGVWVVGDYLAAPVAPGAAPDFTSAGHYFASLLEMIGSPEGGQEIRDRGAAIAAAGHAAAVAELSEKAPGVIAAIADAPDDELIAAIGGKVLTLDDYLVTRIIEQTVHLDDLARSAGIDEGWPLPDDTYDLVNSVAVEIGRRSKGGALTTRALYRQGFAETAFPVL